MTGTSQELLQELAWECEDAGNEFLGCADTGPEDGTVGSGVDVPREREPLSDGVGVLGAGDAFSACSINNEGVYSLPSEESPAQSLKLQRGISPRGSQPLRSTANWQTPTRSSPGASPSRHVDEIGFHPIMDLLLEVAQERDIRKFNEKTDGKSLVDLLLESFAMLGISNIEELHEQLVSDSRHHEHAWIGTRDALLSILRGNLIEFGLQPEDVRPALAAASSLLSKVLRRFYMQRRQPGCEEPFTATFAPSVRDTNIGVLPSRGAPVCCVGVHGLGLIAACQAIDVFKDDDDEESGDLHEAIRTIDRVTAEVSQIMSDCRKAPRHEVRALLERKRVLESLPEYVQAKRFLEEHVPGSRSRSRQADQASPNVLVVRRQDQVLLRL